MTTKFKFYLLAICSIFLLASCSSDDEATIADLSGTYVGTKIETSNCTDSAENVNYSGNSDDGICFEEDGLTGCILLELTFNNNSYTATYTINAGGFMITSTDTGTYDPDAGADEICIDGDCGDIQVSNNGDKLTFTGNDPETGCDLRFELEKR